MMKRRKRIAGYSKTQSMKEFIHMNKIKYNFFNSVFHFAREKIMNS